MQLFVFLTGKVKQQIWKLLNKVHFFKQFIKFVTVGIK